MDTERIVVIGADAAGMSAAHQALRTAKAAGRAIEVVALERTQDTSYSACGIPYWLAGDVGKAEDLVARSAQKHRDMGVDLRTGMTATGVDLAAHTVAYVDQAGVTHSLGFDQLVIATGARPVVPDWALGPDGSPYGGVRPVKNLEDGAAWMSLFERPFGAPGETAGRVVITGGGYLGVEMAETALRLGYAVTLLTRSKVMGSLDPDMSDRIAAALTEAGVEVVENAEVAGVSTDDGWVRSVRSTGGDSYPCDLLVLALGVTPVTEFLSGLPLGDSGGLLADPRGAVAPGVWAAGDCCEVRHRLTDSMDLSAAGNPRQQSRAGGRHQCRRWIVALRRRGRDGDHPVRPRRHLSRDLAHRTELGRGGTGGHRRHVSRHGGQHRQRVHA